MIGHHGRGGGQNTSKRVVWRTLLVPFLVAVIKIPRVRFILVHNLRLQSIMVEVVGLGVG